jgi:hypothetical protein
MGQHYQATMTGIFSASLVPGPEGDSVLLQSGLPNLAEIGQYGILHKSLLKCAFY